MPDIKETTPDPGTWLRVNGEKGIYKNGNEGIINPWAKMAEDMGSFDQHLERDIEKNSIKVLDSELNEIDDPASVERVGSVLEKQIDFLSDNYGIDRRLLQSRLDNISIVKWKPGTGHSVFYNGVKYQIAGGRGDPGAFVTRMEQSFDGDSWSFKEAIFFDDAVDNHVLSHELFHAFSAKDSMGFNDEGVGYNKNGVSIDGYNRQDEKIDASLYAKGLNEGITELLATKFSSDERPVQYEPQAYLSDILISPNNNRLLTAYFSNDEDDFRSFLSDFERRQGTLPSSSLVELPIRTNEPISKDLIKACVEYTISYCDDVEQLTEERKRLIPVFNKILKHNRLNGNEGNSQEIIDTINSVLLSKREELSSNKN
ncbi:hypothetical protein IKX73_01105 [Candidatus Saccharibacteria bacterium]|nr:hypothetical protein [Candidatus Saccharibacteria bacterium]